MIHEIDTSTLLRDPKIIAALIGAGITLVLSIASSIISIINNNKNRKLIKEVEFLKNELQKETISFQIFKTELAKRKFEKLDLLYNSLIDYIDHVKIKIGTDHNLTVPPRSLVKESDQLFAAAWTNFRKSRLYLSKALINSIYKLLYNCKDATDNYFLREESSKGYDEFSIKLFDNIAKIEPLLREIEDAIKLNFEDANQNKTTS